MSRLAHNNEKLTLQIMKDLHEHWSPHSGQVKVGKELFTKDVRNIMIQCGRKWGKSEFSIYALWRWALLNPGSACYYLAPQYKQAKEIIWAANRIQTFGPRKYINKINSVETRITFKNGSFIKVDGSDNYEAYRGITPDFVVYDEFKDFNPKFHVGMEPNLAVNKAPLLIIGTPPDRECQYTDMADEFKGRSDASWFRMDSFTNPHIPHEWLKRQKEILTARGEEDVWRREYEARFVRGGASSIFPMFSPDRHLYDHKQLVQEISRDLKKLDWFCITDPGTTTCFAVLFGCVNPYTKELYILDEIYETDQSNTSVRIIYPKIELKQLELFKYGDPDDGWMKVYDEAAAWFSNEVMHQYGVYYMPTAKHLNKKEHGISLVKDLLAHDLVKISDRCKKLEWEMINYVKDDKGNIPKKDDHLIDCFRYLLAAANYNMIEVVEIKRKNMREGRRGYSLSEDYTDFQLESDWTNVWSKDWRK